MELYELYEMNPFSIVNLFPQENLIERVENNDEEDLVEGFGAGGIFLMVLLCCLLYLYSNYIIIKCYCGDFLYILVFGLLLSCFPLCTIPYLYYQHFVKGCGKGRIGFP